MNMQRHLLPYSTTHVVPFLLPLYGLLPGSNLLPDCLIHRYANVGRFSFVSVIEPLPHQLHSLPGLLLPLQRFAFWSVLCMFGILPLATQYVGFF
ncbi:hypothetical protein BJX99DRAFT_203867 [Aspergillus californicus]